MSHVDITGVPVIDSFIAIVNYSMSGGDVITIKSSVL